MCKLFNMLATPLLYQSLIFRSPSYGGYMNWIDLPGDEYIYTRSQSNAIRLNPFYRLLYGENTAIRAFVRKLTIESSRTIYGRLDRSKLHARQSLLVEMIKKLPNLEEVL